ncbi:hypothetical protein KKC1_13500, partial [Calderihabitans maritimus]
MRFVFSTRKKSSFSYLLTTLSTLSTEYLIHKTSVLFHKRTSYPFSLRPGTAFKSSEAFS